MTDETRDKLREAANTYASYFEDDQKNDIRQAFNAGATEVRPIAEKAGYNHGLDTAIEIVRSVDPAFIIQELEALKTEIKK